MIKRYCDLLLYAVISYLILSFVGETRVWGEWLKLWQKFHATQGGVLASHIPTQVLFVLTGLLVSSLASHFQIYHSKRPLWPSLRFPPLTFSIGLAVVYWCFQFNSVLLTLIFSSWGLLVGLLILPLLHYFYRKRSVRTCAKSNDLPKSSMSDLDPEPQHAAKLLLRKLKDENRHIALCGAFGTGKSSVINAVLARLEDDSKDSVIRCNIDLWGVTTNSIVEFVLDEITLALSAHFDVSGLRRLPARYLEAIRTSNTSWSFLSSLLNKHESPDKVLLRLDELLEVSRKKLIVTIQDIDRNQDAKSSMTELAGLLERLKQYGHNITYIFAAENTPEFSETIRRICPVRVDLAKPFLIKDVELLHQSLVATLSQNYLTHLSGREITFDAAIIANLLPSYRAFNVLEKMVQQAWGNNEGEGRLSGEVYPHELILMYALKNEYPQIFDLVIHADSTGTENTLAVLLAKHMPQCSVAEKDFILTVFQFFGFLDESLFDFTRLPESGDVKSDNVENDRGLTDKFGAAPDVLSIINTDRKKLIQRGAIFDTEFSHREAYLLFDKIAGGNLQEIDTMISEICNGSREPWLYALNSYGMRSLFTYTQDHKVPQQILLAFLSVPEGALSYRLITSIYATLQNPITRRFAPNNSFTGYFDSDQFCDDMLQRINDFKAGALGSILLILSLMKYWDGEPHEQAKKAKHSIQKLVKTFANEGSEKSTAILIDLFAELGQKYKAHLEEPLREALIRDDLDLINQQFESVDLDSIELLNAYQKLYPEYSHIQSMELVKAYEAANAGLARLI